MQPFYKKDLKQAEMKALFERTYGASKQNDYIFYSSITEHTKHLLNQTVKDNIREFITNNIKQREEAQRYADTTQPGEKIPKRGKGLKHRHRVINGRGLPLTSKQSVDMFLDLPNANLYLERTKLKNRNILSVKYKSNRNNHPDLKQLRVSKNLLSIIEDILDGHFDERIVKLLSPDELSVLDTFIRIANYSIVLGKEELINFQKDYDILLGEFQSGNDNPKIKNELKNTYYMQ